MKKSLMFSRLNQPPGPSNEKPGFMWIQIMHKTCSGKRPKQKVYHRVHELDRAMDHRKKPLVILQLKSIIESQKHKSLQLRDLEKEVGFIQKWNYMAVIEKYPKIFHVSDGDGTPPRVTLTEKAKSIAAEEVCAREQMEPILVKNLRKLLMLSVDCRVPLNTIRCIEAELGLPNNFESSLLPKYPHFFSVKDIRGKAYLHLENWDSSLAVTAREEKLDSVWPTKKVRITRDGNFKGRFAFNLNFPIGFRPNASFLEELQKWQKLEFPSPFLNARNFDPTEDPKARKRVIAVLHELLSLTMEKRLTSGQIEAFHLEYRLPARLLLCLIKHHGIFYVTNKGVRSSVFLKEAYDGSNLIEKCPLLSFRDKFVTLAGRKDVSFCNDKTPSLSVI